ncbi:hypothetical protein [Citricoccus sp. NR2]|uniref:hypothetical protein n=1 Tax=Citricoccus sp. NR2 TaxID=3004095 RepID=UPI0022DD9C20|nr:hypothetical protein [Citricoccus sp. NR2]WBL19200.1 hypothetical protein O1A05_00385 [Citricoccus sp. NR2]
MNTLTETIEWENGADTIQARMHFGDVHIGYRIDFEHEEEAQTFGILPAHIDSFINLLIKVRDSLRTDSEKTSGPDDSTKNPVQTAHIEPLEEGTIMPKSTETPLFDATIEGDEIMGTTVNLFCFYDKESIQFPVERLAALANMLTDLAENYG